MSSSGRTWRGFAAGAALVAAACGESAGPAPTLSNPQQLSSDLQTVGNVFQTPAFQSFAALATVPGSPVAASAPAGALLSAARVAAPQPYADAPAQLQVLRSAASALSSRLTAQVIPPDLWGKTFVWDVNTHQYAVGADPGPSTGVRIILYQVDANGAVIEPPQAVGFVDLVDQSSGNTNQVHVTVQGGTPGSAETTYADYVVSATVVTSGTGAVSEFTATALGSVSDGTRTLHFNAAFHATNLDTDNPDAQVDVTWDLDHPAVSVALHETLTTPDADHVNLTIDFSVTRGGETVRLTGTVSVVVSTQSVTADLTVYVNGATFARISGSDATIQARHPNGSALSQDEEAAIVQMFVLPDRLVEAIEQLFHPAEHFLGA